MKIKELILYTQNLESQIDFYTKVLEFEIFFRDQEKCSFLIGNTVLTFRSSEKSTPYHFAFNIPSNKIDEAQDWLKRRVGLLTHQNKEIVNFHSWNAKAIYFYDLDKNIVEFIARKNINRISSQIFSSKSILNISEIGIGSSEIERTYKVINALKPIEVYSGSFERFCALGNEEGMFIMGNPILKKWFPSDDYIHQSDFIINGDYNFEFRKGELQEIN